MSDIVERLREYGDNPQDVSDGEWAEWSHKAADDLELLRREPIRSRTQGAGGLRMTKLRLINLALFLASTLLFAYEWHEFAVLSFFVMGYVTRMIDEARKLEASE